MIIVQYQIIATVVVVVISIVWVTKKIMSKRSKKSEDSQEDGAQFSKVYYDPLQPEAFAGASRLKKKFPKKNVKKWLSGQLAYSLHKPMVRKFPTRKYKTSGPNEMWQMDLMEMIPYSKVNAGQKYILTCIDAYSRFAYAEPVKAKNAKAMTVAITKMMKANTPRHVQTDLGKEFYNSLVQNFFKQRNINHYSVHSQFKAALVERFNRTLRERLNRFFTYQGSKKWVKALPQIIDAYNHSTHRSLPKGKRPVDLYETTFHLGEWEEQDKETNTKRRRKNLHPIGTLVRISRISIDPFRKNFDQNWSEEIFRVAKQDKSDIPVMYILKDLNNEVIQGKFYHDELQDIGNTLPIIARVEKIIRTKGAGKNKQYLIKWHGYDESHNSWITRDKFT